MTPSRLVPANVETSPYAEKQSSTFFLDDVATPDSIIIPENITEISSSVFSNRGNLVNVTLPSSLKKIGEYAFSCTGITSVGLPEGLTQIGEHAFYCSQLITLSLPSTVVTIEKYAFYGNYFTEVNIPASVKKLGEHSLDVYGLEKVTVNAEIPNCSEYAFGYTFNGYNEKEGYYYLGNDENPYILKVKSAS